MTVWSILLRLLLAAGLVLNGSGYAVASVHMQLGSMEMADASHHAVAGSAATALPCDTHLRTATAVLETGCADTGGDMALMTSGDAPSDCCQADACSCLCVNPGCVVMPVVAVMTAVIGCADMPQAMELDRPAPVLQGVIRPPIG